MLVGSCQVCGVTFFPKGRTAKYCGDGCRKQIRRQRRAKTTKENQKP